MILLSPKGSSRVDSTKIRAPPRRCTSTSAATSSGLDAVRPRRREDRAILEVERDLRTRRAGVERDVVDADAGLLDGAVIVRADRLAVLGDAHLQHGLGLIGAGDLTGGQGGAAHGDDKGGHGDRERWVEVSAHTREDAGPRGLFRGSRRRCGLLGGLLRQQLAHRQRRREQGGRDAPPADAARAVLGGHVGRSRGAHGQVADGAVEVGHGEIEGSSGFAVCTYARGRAGPRTGGSSLSPCPRSPASPSSPRPRS